MADVTQSRSISGSRFLFTGRRLHILHAAAVWLIHLVPLRSMNHWTACWSAHSQTSLLTNSPANYLLYDSLNRRKEELRVPAEWVAVRTSPYWTVTPKQKSLQTAPLAIKLERENEGGFVICPGASLCSRTIYNSTNYKFWMYDGTKLSFPKIQNKIPISIGSRGSIWYSGYIKPIRWIYQ